MMSDKDNAGVNLPPPPLKKKKALGRGLAALLGEGARNIESSELKPVEKAPVEKAPMSAPGPITKLKVADIIVNPEQPRRYFNEAKLLELASSIKEQGIIQPIVVKKLESGKFQIVAGERRFRASQKVGLSEVPVVVRTQKGDSIDHDLASLAENIQRENLNPVELAIAYDALLKTRQFTQESLAKKLGLSRVSIANTVRLLNLPENVRTMIVEKKISEGHARTLLALPSQELMKRTADSIVEKSLSVRDSERYVRSQLGRTESTKENSSKGESREFSVREKLPKSDETVALEDELKKRFGAKVLVNGNGKRGSVEVFYSDPDSFMRIIHRMRAIEE